jgi:hypothetical protein
MLGELGLSPQVVSSLMYSETRLASAWAMGGASLRQGVLRGRSCGG